MNNTDDTKNLPALIRLLADGAESEHVALAQPAREALGICQSEFAVYAATNFQLRNALASIRARRPGDAVQHIKAALDIGGRWVGAENPSSPPTESRASWIRPPWENALYLIGATLLVLPVGVMTLAAGAIARPSTYIHDRLTALFKALLEEMGLRL